MMCCDSVDLVDVVGLSGALNIFSLCSSRGSEGRGDRSCEQTAGQGTLCQGQVHSQAIHLRRKENIRRIALL